MKESLEAVRNIHQILIVVVTIVIIFAISNSRESNKYDIALEEINKFESILDTVSSIRVNIIANNFEKELRHKTTSMVIPVIENNGGSDFKRKKLEEICNYLDANWNELDNVLVYDFESNPIIKYDESAISYLFWSSQRFPVNAVEIPFGFNKISTMKIYDESGSYSYYLRREGLLDSAYTSNSFLPTVKSIWKEVRSLNLEECKILLESQARAFSIKAQRDVDVSGLKVAGKYMFIVGPFLIAALLMYMITLVNHISSIVSTNENLPMTFPWLALFRDKFSEILMTVTLSFYPLFATVLIVFNSNLANSEAVNFAIAYVILFGFLGLRVVFKISILKEKIFNPDFIEEPSKSFFSNFSKRNMVQLLLNDPVNEDVTY